MKTFVLFAFPATGKTYLKETLKGSGISILDSDSSGFNKKEFPKNYVSYIESQLGKVDIILVSTHKEVREAIENSDILLQADCFLIYPSLSLKDAIIDRCKRRGNSSDFIDKLSFNYEDWVTSCKEDTGIAKHCIENESTYLSDCYIVKEILSLLYVKRACYSHMCNLTEDQEREMLMKCSKEELVSMNMEQMKVLKYYMQGEGHVEYKDGTLIMNNNPSIFCDYNHSNLCNRPLRDCNHCISKGMSVTTNTSINGKRLDRKQQ